MLNSFEMELGEFGGESLEATGSQCVSSIVPKVGCFLGLDISKNSSGITVYENGILSQYNIEIFEPENRVFREVLYRRSLKSELSVLFYKKQFNLILIEDAYQGENPETTRLLYALNTAMDELVLDGCVGCEKYLRVNNNLWKSWLFSVDVGGVTKGYNDKVKIQMCMEMLGIKDSGEGFQDRLDSHGMLLGYFLKGQYDNTVGKKKVRISDIEVCYELEMSDVLEQVREKTRDREVEAIDLSRVSEKYILELLSESPESIFVSSNYVKVGNLAKKFGLGYISEGGVLGFWVKEKSLKKYKG